MATTRELKVTTPLTSGPDVLAVQQRLEALGFDVGTPDGKYGSGTEAAVRAFQQAHQLGVDGVVGANTSKALASAQPGNASAFDKQGVAPPPPHVPPGVRDLLVHWATWGLMNQQHFSYTLGPKRNEMFNRAPGDVSAPIHADCSQFYAACCKWAGVPGTSDSDFTGTLLDKGKLVPQPQPGDCVVWGPGTGEHAAMYVGDGWTIGFGHSPGAPNRVREADMTSWMNQHGFPGVRYLSFVQ